MILSNQEQGVIQFKSVVHDMQFKITLDPKTLQSLHLNIFPASEQFKNSWSADDLQTLERFVEVKVLCAPYKPNSFNSITRLLNVPYEILKDCIHLMKLELVSNQCLEESITLIIEPIFVTDQVPDRSTKWLVQWNLTIPPGSPLTLLQHGMSSITTITHQMKNTTLLFYVSCILCFTSVKLSNKLYLFLFLLFLVTIY